jgi:hypothetical protein
MYQTVAIDETKGTGTIKADRLIQITGMKEAYITKILATTVLIDMIK